MPSLGPIVMVKWPKGVNFFYSTSLWRLMYVCKFKGPKDQNPKPIFLLFEGWIFTFSNAFEPIFRKEPCQNSTCNNILHLFNKIYFFKCILNLLLKGTMPKFKMQQQLHLLKEHLLFQMQFEPTFNRNHVQIQNVTPFWIFSKKYLHNPTNPSMERAKSIGHVFWKFFNHL